MDTMFHRVSRAAKTVAGWMKEVWLVLCCVVSVLKRVVRGYAGKPDLEESISCGDVEGIVASLLTGQTLALPDEMFRKPFLGVGEEIQKAVWLLGVPAHRRQEFLQVIRKWIEGVKDGTIPAMLRKPYYPAAPWKAMWRRRSLNAEAMLKRFEQVPEALPQVRDEDLEKLLGTAPLLDANSLKAMVRGSFTVVERVALFSRLKRHSRRKADAVTRKAVAFALLA